MTIKQLEDKIRESFPDINRRKLPSDDKFIFKAPKAEIDEILNDMLSIGPLIGKIPEGYKYNKIHLANVGVIELVENEEIEIIKDGE